MLGDSITAGFGIKGKEGLFEEFRGLSGSIGGDKNAITVANFFKHFVPNVQGASVGKHVVEFPRSNYHPGDELNAAQSGATVNDLDFQVNYLVQKMKNNSMIDFKSDWKILSILIGANDACHLCEASNPPPVDIIADKFAITYDAIIDKLQQQIPRLFINILPMFNASGLYYLTRNVTYCKDLHIIFPSECPCAFTSDIVKRTYMDSVLQAFNKRTYNIAQKWQKKHLDDFIVTMQPLFINLTIPDISFLSTLDCFHPSHKAHEITAVAGWNSLISPVSKKRRTFYPDDPLLCPDANTLLYTDLFTY